MNREAKKRAKQIEKSIKELDRRLRVANVPPELREALWVGLGITVIAMLIGKIFPHLIPNCSIRSERDRKETVSLATNPPSTKRNK